MMKINWIKDEKSAKILQVASYFYADIALLKEISTPSIRESGNKFLHVDRNCKRARIYECIVYEYGYTSYYSLII